MKKHLSLSAIVILFASWSWAAGMKAEAVPGEYIVKLKSDVGARDLRKLESDSGFAIRRGSSASQLLFVHSSQKPEQVYRQLKTALSVEYIEPNYRVHVSDLPDDKKFSNQWGLKNSNGVDIHAEKLWSHSVSSGDIIVGVTDTGISVDHPDLKENIWVNEAEANGKPGVDDDGNGFVDDVHGFHFAYPKKPVSDQNGHGTHCAGIIGGVGNNKVGVAGVLWKTRLLAAGFLDKNGSGSLEGAIQAIDYAVQMGAKVISASWGGSGRSQALEEAIRRAGDQGAVFVAAAGNESKDIDRNPSYPASYQLPNVITVAAIEKRGTMAWFSNRGVESVHVAAPGHYVLSTYKSTGYAYLSGTSMAAPFVSGVVAMMMSRHPELTPAEIKQRVIDTATPMKYLEGKILSGGLVNAEGAL